MEDGRIPKDILYRELSAETRTTGRPILRFKDIVKRDMKALNINRQSWEDPTADRSKWKGTLTEQLQSSEKNMMRASEGKQAHRKV